MDVFHYLIGGFIVAFLIWLLIQIHRYFSRDNVPLEMLLGKSTATNATATLPTTTSR
jgi:hypothetical protein